ncbi:hypothetical protein FTV88_2662 [Heliorestis convoluta]|uniref:Uncharacterized protein n=1 Tax=Heliorestis convoluta TaxID=356322 RepID=A0A5Q2N8C9_9FIRM|nr:hypothetical protein FTV88_2662 [Heliorestis convoluta]
MMMQESCCEGMPLGALRDRDGQVGKQAFFSLVEKPPFSCPVFYVAVIEERRFFYADFAHHC